MYQTLSELLVKTSGQKLDDNQSSEKSIKTLMLIHGWGMNSHVWEPIREALEFQYHIIWIDLPGHGFNRHLEAKSLEYIVELISDQTPKNTHILGWSLGGLVAQALAQRIPQKISSLTLVTSTPRFSQIKNNDWTHAMSDQVLNRFADNLKQDIEKTLKGFIALQFIGVKNAKKAQDDLISHVLSNGKNAQPRHSRGNKGASRRRPEGQDEIESKWGGINLADSIDHKGSDIGQISNIPTQEALDVGLSILKDDDLRLVKPTCPEHWLFAEYDRLIPKEVINDLISLRPDAEITLLEKAGHAPFITHSESFLKQVTHFIDAQL